jgi:translation initiation factor IF-2
VASSDRPRVARADDEPAQDLGDRKDFPLLVKGDVQGSVEAIVRRSTALGTDEVAARVMHMASAASPNPT